MKKQYFAFLLALLLLLQSFVPATVLAEEEKITWRRFSNVANAGFEDVLAGAPRKWTLTGAGVDDGFYIAQGKGMVHSGESSLKMATEAKDAPMYAAQVIAGAKGGTEYKVSFWTKIVRRNDRGIAIKVEDARGGMILQQHFGEAPTNRWTEQSFTFTLPEGDSFFNILLRLWDGGEVYWDDIAVTGLFDAAQDATVELLTTKQEPAEPKVPEVPAADEMIQNGDFEIADESGIGAQGWSAYRGWSASNKQVTVSKGNAYSGDACILVATATGGNPWVSQFIPNLQEETKYQFAIWYNTTASNVAFKLEYYTGDEMRVETTLTTFANGRLEVAPPTNGQWQQYVTTFVTPPGAKSVAIYPRLYCNGDVYFDKASLSMTEQSHVLFTTDDVFYYSDRTEDGVATAVANTRHYPDLVGYTISFALTDGETVLDAARDLPLEGSVTYRFSPLRMTEKQKDYTVSATVYAPDGSEMETVQQTVSRWDRPTRITTDGKYMVDGKEFVPVIGYNVPVSAYPLCKEVGINVVQFAMTANLRVTRETLDAARDNGLMVLGCLYANVKPSAHPDNLQNTIKIVTEVRDHPALFAYAVLDEPHMQWNNLDDLFQKSYKTIRSIDETRPIYLVEAACNTAMYAETAKYCDVFAVDPYAVTAEVSTEAERHVRLAQEAVKYKKPVLALFKTYGEEKGHFPTIDELRYEFYRAFMLGASGVGIYRFASAYTAADGTVKHLSDTQLWKDWTAFNETEFKEATADFITDPKPIFSDLKTDDYCVRSYVKNGKITLLLLNRSNEAKHVSVPLTSSDGKLSVAGYKATVKGKDTVINGNGVLEYDLAATGVEVFEITPTAAMDFSALSASRFADLEGYGWARTQIDTLDKADIINDRTYKSYAPGEKITRGEFAYFLVRTLQLTAETPENFVDVDEDAFYAKEIAIGKALGILKGMGNNLYGPETEISRQDLMVICARAMELAPSEEEITFPDKTLIASYAMAEVAAMVRANIIKGNADGTINPLGTTTRAEAAVIMQRISVWAKEP